MYCTTLQCTYLEKESTELYQQELLQAFQCSTVEELTHALEQLEITLQSDKLSNLLQKVVEVNQVHKDLAFYMLFSYDYFYYMHQYILDPTTYSILYDKIKV